MLLAWAGIFVFVMLGIVRQGMSEKIITEQLEERSSV